MTGIRERVDVGVVTWNTADLTVAALRRLLDSDQGCDLRILVRDNASEDGTADAIARRVPEAELERGDENLGFAAGMNRLIARSDADWFFPLNSDAWPEPGAIGTLVKTANTHGDAAAIAPRLVRPDGTLEHSTYPFPSLKVAAVTALGRRVQADRAKQMMLVGAWLHDEPRSVDWAIGAALLMRGDALRDVGGFDESFFMYVEDLDWCWRARRRGWDIRFEPAAVVVHVGNASGAQRFGSSRTRTYMANTNRFYRREHGFLAAGAYRGLNLAGTALHYLRARRAGNRGLADYWRGELSAQLPIRGNGRPDRAGGDPPG